MKNPGFRILAAMLLIAIGFNSCVQQPRFGEAGKNAVRDTVNQLMASISAHAAAAQADSVFQWFSNDSLAMFFSGGQSYTRAGILSRFRDNYRGLKEQVFDKPRSYVIVFSPDAAAWIGIIKGNYTTQEGEKYEEYLLETWLWRKENNSWKVAHYHESYPKLPSASEKALVEKALSEMAVQLNRQQLTPGVMPPLLKAFLEEHTFIYGAMLAFAPSGGHGNKHEAAPYIYRTGGAFRQVELPESYDYTQSDWYSVPASTRKPGWSDPYYDAGGGGVVMITYAIPLFDNDDSLVGVLTSDLEIK